MDSLNVNSLPDNREKAYKLFKISRIIAMVLIALFLIYIGIAAYIIFNGNIFIYLSKNLTMLLSALIVFPVSLGIIGFLTQIFRFKAITLYTGKDRNSLSRNDVINAIKDLKNKNN